MTDKLLSLSSPEDSGEGTYLLTRTLKYLIIFNVENKRSAEQLIMGVQCT